MRWTILPYPRYSPDLVPSDLHLFGPLQDALEDDVLWMMRAETRCVCVCVKSCSAAAKSVMWLAYGISCEGGKSVLIMEETWRDLM